MTAHEIFKIAAQVALDWDRKNYKRINQEEAWKLGYDVEGEMLILETEVFSAVASADYPTEIEVATAGPKFELFVIDLETRQIMSR